MCECCVLAARLICTCAGKQAKYTDLILLNKTELVDEVALDRVIDDLVELNPFLDERGRTASLLVDLTASLLGRRVLDRKTRSFAA